MKDILRNRLAPLGETVTPAAVLSDKRGLSASLPEVLGAVGISILVLGLAGFGIGAGINFAQDSGAKSTLESVNAAQILHQTKNNTFGGLDDLTAGDSPALSSTPDNVGIHTSQDGRNYCAIIESGSMSHTKFWITSKDGKVVDKMPDMQQYGLSCPSTAFAT